MKTPQVTPLRFPIAQGASVSAILRVPSDPTACLVFAHGAGAGMNHSFITDLVAALGEHQIATLRYQFPFMEQGGKRPDTPGVAHQTVRAAVKEAETRLPGVPLFAGENPSAPG